MKEYKYQPLDDGEIRLVRFRPTPPGSPLTGEIFHHFLENPVYHPKNEETGAPAYLEHKLAYEAVSYHWGGDARRPFQIIIDDGESEKSVIKITKTLNSALRRILSPDHDHIIWADAICINQVNAVTNVEKGKQIELMPDIYRIASCVQVYLGDAANNSELGIGLLEKIAEYSEDIDDSWADDSAVNGYNIAVLKGMRLPDSSDKAWSALRAFFHRPWFKRVWILQEFVYAADIRVRCGDREIDWRHLWLASKAYIASPDLAYAGYDLKSILQLIQRRRCEMALQGAVALHIVTDLRMRAWGYMSPQYVVMTLAEKDSGLHGVRIKRDYAAIVDFEKTMAFVLLDDRANGKIFTFGRLGLLELLQRTAKFQATHAVDKLFALLNIAEDSGDLKPIYSAEYTMEKVQWDWAKYMIQNDQAVEVISMAGIRSQDPKPTDPPSWVPDWAGSTSSQDRAMALNFRDWARSKSRGNTLSSEESKAENSKRPPAAERLYSAAGETEVDMRLSPDGKMLITKVVPIDLVQIIIPGKLLLGTPFYASVVNKYGDAYMGQPMETALWRTLIANRTHQGEKPGDDMEEQYLNFKQREVPLQNAGVLIFLIAIVIGFPTFIFVMRKVNMFIQAILLGYLVTRRNLLPAKEVIVYCMCLPLMQYLPLTVLIPLLLVASYHLLDAYFMTILPLGAMIGISALSYTQVLPDCADFQAAYNRTGGRHELCKTVRASYLALVPPLARPGDVICVAMGFDAPLVLRSTAKYGEYRLVGEAYVHGMMEGQAMEQEPIEIGLI